MRIALVHDRLTGIGEPEKVFFCLMELFPGAEIFTLAYQPEVFGDRFQNRKVTVSSLQRLPFGKTRDRLYLPFYPGLMRGFDLSGFDLVVSSSTGAAQWVVKPEAALHVCFFHSLLEGLWEGQGGGWMGLFRSYLRRWDKRSNDGVTKFLVASEEMKAKVGRYYEREADVIPPPWDAKFEFRVQVYFRRLYGIKPVGEE